MANELFEALNGEVFKVWFLVGVILVFWMQAGFAMVEAGFSRAKNAGNILMKNLMDFCIGCVMFILIGYSLLLGDDMAGIAGRPGFSIFTDYGGMDWASFIFNLVFCATTATIVSGAVAERTKFLSYCIYSGILSALIYPIEAHWVWGGGWLSQLGFHDFAGSCAIHMVGGIAAVTGAVMVGPRLGKFERNREGRVVKVNAFPGHNLVIGALGVFILWMGWYGFNGAACTMSDQLASVFVVTTIAPSIATFVCMIFTWLKYGKPDVSMCLNASLAGLVAITAGCDVTDAAGSLVIGAVSGLLVCFGVWILDYRFHIDDPVGAVAVHMLNGIWGTLAVGLFATGSVPGNDQMVGLFYGGGLKLLGIQLLGTVAIAAWAAVSMAIVFKVIKGIFGLRVTEEEEIEGLDIREHGLASAYAGFSVVDMTSSAMFANENTNLGVSDYDKASETFREAAVPVENAALSMQAAGFSTGMHKVVIITKLAQYDKIKKALNDLGVTGITVTQVSGCGIQKGAGQMYRGVEMDMTLLPKIKLEVVVCGIPVDSVIETAKRTLYTGKIGDGKIFVYPVSRVVKIRTGEENYAALQDVE